MSLCLANIKYFHLGHFGPFPNVIRMTLRLQRLTYTLKIWKMITTSLTFHVGALAFGTEGYNMLTMQFTFILYAFAKFPKFPNKLFMVLITLNTVLLVQSLYCDEKNGSSQYLMLRATWDWICPVFIKDRFTISNCH